MDFGNPNYSPSSVKFQIGPWLANQYKEEEDEENKLISTSIEKEHMFDKIVTPSDVGKLNRLVIPKQYAEKYFPLDSSTNEKGLLLNFEDRIGKPWRFRYSYWNSSQSYVMTKGWSRFVKEKKLDAGDIVSFLRGVGDASKDLLYIDCRRRPDETNHHHHNYHHQVYPVHQSIPWCPLLIRPYPTMMPRDHLCGGFNPGMMRMQRGESTRSSGQYYQQREREREDEDEHEHVVEPMMVYESVPVVEGKAAAKRLRLFGVNMECPILEDNECEILPSTTLVSYAPSTSSISSFELGLSSLPIIKSQVHRGSCSRSLDLDTSNF